MSTTTAQNIATGYNIRRAEEGAKRALRIIERAKKHLAQGAHNSDTEELRAANQDDEQGA